MQTSCITGEIEEEKTNGIRNVNVQFFNNVDTAKSALSMTSDLSIGGDVSGFGSAGMKADILRSLTTSISDKKTYAMLHINIKTGRKFYKNASLDSDKLVAIETATKSKSNLMSGFRPYYQNSFLPACGNAYISSVVMGGEIIGVVEVTEMSEDIESELKSNFGINGEQATDVVIKKVSSGKAESSVSVDNSTKKSKSKMIGQVKVWINGGKISSEHKFTELSFDQFIDLAGKFATTVEQDGGSNPLTALITNNVNLLNQNRNPPIPLNKYAVRLKDIEAQLLRLGSSERDWNDAIRHPPHPGFSEAIARKSIADVKMHREKLRQIQTSCIGLDDKGCVDYKIDFDQLSLKMPFSIQIETIARENNIDDGFLFWGGYPECIVKFEVCTDKTCRTPKSLYISPYHKWGSCNLDFKKSFSPKDIAVRAGREVTSEKIDDLFIRVSIQEAETFTWKTRGKSIYPMSDVLKNKLAQFSIIEDDVNLNVVISSVTE